jgi:hypothetical protein
METTDDVICGRGLRRLVAGLPPWRPGFDLQTRLCGIYGEQSGTGEGFSPINIIPPTLYTYSSISHRRFII